ncbi:MAG: RsmE family RNA methyltransferase [Victivallaceae bacterium]
MHSFYCKQIGEPGTAVELEELDFKHLFKTLRAVAGEKLKLLDGRGMLAEAVVADGRRIVVENRKVLPAPPVGIHLYVAIPRKQKMDQLLKQAAEIGIKTIVPMLTERSVATPEKVNDRWLALLQEGCKQARNPFLPEITNPVRFTEAIAALKASGITGFFGAVCSENRPAGKIQFKELAWLVGPEGGFTAEEEAEMRNAGISGLNIGPYIMRVETAAVAGAALLMYEAMTTAENRIGE